VKKKGLAAMSDAQLIQYARAFMKENGIAQRSHIHLAYSGLYKVLSKRKLLRRIDIEDKQRYWSHMSNDQLIQHAQEFMKGNGITGKHELEETDKGLYLVLKKRKLLAKVGFKQKFRECRHWSSMSHDLLIQHAQTFMREYGITRKIQLKKADHGLYEVLRRRNLICEAFANIDLAKYKTLQSKLVSGLNEAADAMKEFGEGK
jgi:hypothetical protein